MRHASRTASLALLAMLMVAATGCSGRGSGTTMLPPITGEPSSSAPATAAPATGPTTTPESGSAPDLTKKAPRPAPKPVAAPTPASFEAFALKSASSFAGAAYTGEFTVRAKIAKDTNGGWWGNAVAEPSESGLEPIGIWASYSKGRWTGEIADFSTEGSEEGFFPPDVLAKLTL